MAAARQRRLMKEIDDCRKDAATTGIHVEAIGDNLSHLKGKFPGPTGSVYEGGTFEVDIVVPDNYPFSPLKMKFLTRTYHPNVSSQSGAICLDILKSAWSPVLTLKTTLVSLQSLLCSPEPSDPQDAEVAKVFISDRATFDRTARYWTESYAGAPSSSSSSSSIPSSKTDSRSSSSAAAVPDPIAIAGLDPNYVSQFVAMGFPQAQVIDVMKRLNYRGRNAATVGEEAVVEQLLR